MTRILLRALKECLGLGLKATLARTFVISTNVGDYRVGFVQALMNTSKKNVYITIGLSRVEADSIEGAELSFRDLAKRKLDQPETVFADGRGGRNEKSPLRESFSLHKFGALVENHR